MVADSITDSQLFHGSPISRDDVIKERKANWSRKLKQWKIGAHRRQCLYQCEEEGGSSRLRSLRDKPHDIKTLSDKFSQAWYIDDDSDDDDETALSAASGSPTSVLKNKDSDDDCFCCSKEVAEEEQEEDSVDEEDNSSSEEDDYSDALRMFFEEDPSQSNKSSKKKKKKTNKNKKKKKKEGDCPVCAEKMDETDLKFKPCSCAYKMCLFCYNKINEETGVCPGCRKMFEQTSSSSGGVRLQQRGGEPIRLSSRFQGLDQA